MGTETGTDGVIPVMKWLGCDIGDFLTVLEQCDRPDWPTEKKRAARAALIMMAWFRCLASESGKLVDDISFDDILDAFLDKF